VGLLQEIQANGIDLYLHVQGIDTQRPAGRALFQILGSSLSSSPRETPGGPAAS
jgi:DNA invertase Pin-like site-specific DNA recombinase